MPFNPPKINFPNFDLSHLVSVLDKSSQQLRQGSETRSNSFRKDTEKFTENWLKMEKTYAMTDIELRSVSMHLMESKEKFTTLIENLLADDFARQLAQSDNPTNKKRLVELTFEYFQILRTSDSKMFDISTKVLEDFKGRHLLLNEYKNNLYYLYDPAEMLIQYKNKEALQKALNLSVNGEYYQTILILELISCLETLNDGEEDTALFEDILQHKNFLYVDGLHIGEYAVQLLIKKMMGNNIGSDFSHWITFIIGLLGDPRTVSRTSAHNVPWERVGQEYRNYLVGLLSREDLNLFLEALSNPDHDDIYQYRKQFWKQFSEYVQYAKIFITENDLQQLDNKFKKRFNGKNSSYSRISDANRSCIYLDLGAVKIIEGTNKARVRIYSKVPIELNKTRYDYQEFYKEKLAQESIVEEFVHHHSERGTWQENVFNLIKIYKNIDIKLKDTLL